MRNPVAMGVLIAGSLALAGCEDPNKKGIERSNQDREVLSEANGAVNEVIRNAADCSVATPLIAEARQKIQEARGRLRIVASQQTLEVLKLQLDRVASACGSEPAS